MSKIDVKNVFIGAIMMFTVVFATYLGLPEEQDNELLLANVEALAGMDVSTGSECPGPKRYSETGIATGEKTVRTHLNDSTDDIYIYSHRFCYADGIGEQPGNNINLGYEFKSKSEGKCLGSIYHNSLFD